MLYLSWQYILCCGEVWPAQEQAFLQGLLTYGQEGKWRPVPVPLSSDAWGPAVKQWVYTAGTEESKNCTFN